MNLKTNNLPKYAIGYMETTTSDSDSSTSYIRIQLVDGDYSPFISEQDLNSMLATDKDIGALFPTNK